MRRNWPVILLAAGFVARLALVPHVAVNDDTGLYIFDSMQLLEGKNMFVDFPSRSPVFEYLLAGFVQLIPEHKVLAARIMMAVIGTSLGGAVYLLAREIASRRAAIVGMCIFLLTPFPLVWGLWVKTEQLAALFSVVAIAIAFTQLDTEKPGIFHGISIGTLLTLAVFSRRAAGVHAILLGAFVLWYRWSRTEYSIRTVLKPAVATIVSGIVTTVIITAVVVGFRPRFIPMYINTYLIHLIVTVGGFSFSWAPFYGVPVHPNQLQASPGVWRYLGCEYAECARVTDIYSKTLFLSLPAVLPGLVWIKETSKSLSFRLVYDLVFLVLLAESFMLFLMAVLKNDPLFVSLLSASVAVVVIWYIETPNIREILTPKQAYVFLTIVALSIVYSYRDRVVFITYFQDFYPFVSILSGIGIVVIWDTLSNYEIEKRRLLKVIFITVFVLAWISAFTLTMPFPLFDSGPSTTFSVEQTVTFSEEIDERLEGNEKVFTAQPLFLINSDHRPVMNLSRKWLIYRRFPDHPKKEQFNRELIEKIKSDSVPIAIMNHDLEAVLTKDETLYRAFNETFCLAEDQPFDEVRAELYVKCSR